MEQFLEGFVMGMIFVFIVPLIVEFLDGGRHFKD